MPLYPGTNTSIPWNTFVPRNTFVVEYLYTPEQVKPKFMQDFAVICADEYTSEVVTP